MWEDSIFIFAMPKDIDKDTCTELCANYEVTSLAYRSFLPHMKRLSIDAKLEYYILPTFSRLDVTLEIVGRCLGAKLFGRRP